MATTGRDNSLGTIVATMDSSVIALPIKIVQIIQITVTRINIETSLAIILITTIDNTTIKVCLTLTLISKTGRDITSAEEGFNPNASYRFQNNDRDLNQRSSQSSIYTKYLELQIRMLQQA